MSKKFTNRKFLFLQGPNSFFFRELGHALTKEGAEIKKINFCGGDLFFWNDNYCTPFEKNISEWKDYLLQLKAEYEFTDIMIYGDCRQYHKIAIKEFSKHVKIHVFEEGYFRPDWVTYEINGVNDNSSMPRNAEFYSSLSKTYEKEKYDYIVLKPSFRQKAFYTCLHYIYRSFFDHKHFPNYVPHRKINPEQEGGAWLRKGFKSYFRKIKAEIALGKILRKARKQRFFLFALQLCTDSQIVEHSDFTGMRDAIDKVLENFATNCPEDNFIVVKTHPEEPGISKLSSKVRETSAKLGISDRVIFIDGGNMPTMLRRMKAMVTVNSTATLSAIHHEKPVKCLGRAFYNFEGLTDQKELSEFWSSPDKPDIEMFNKFKAYIHENSQINGNFYSKQGISITVKNLLSKI